MHRLQLLCSLGNGSHMPGGGLHQVVLAKYCVRKSTDHFVCKTGVYYTSTHWRVEERGKEGSDDLRLYFEAWLSTL